MQIFGILGSLGTFICYFCLKYVYVLRANSYSKQPSFKDVWLFSFVGHPMRRSVIPLKYIAIFFAFTGLFGWSSPISQHDLNTLWRLPAMLIVALNVWARLMIYEFSHWKESVEKSMPKPAMFVILHRSIKEIGWFPMRENWLSTMIIATNILFLLICFIKIIFLLYFS